MALAAVGMRIAMRDRVIVRTGFVTLWIALVPIHAASAEQPNTYGTTAVSYARVPATDQAVQPSV